MQLSRKRFATLYYSPVFVTLEIRLQSCCLKLLCLFALRNSITKKKLSVLVENFKHVPGLQNSCPQPSKKNGVIQSLTHRFRSPCSANGKRAKTENIRFPIKLRMLSVQRQVSLLLVISRIAYSFKLAQ